MTLGLITVLWFIGQWILSGLLRSSLSPGADHMVADLTQQWGLALGWMIPTLCLWGLKPPSSRLKGFFIALGFAIGLAVIGSFAAYIRIAHSDIIGKTPDFDATFSRLSLMLILGQVVMCLPASAVLTGLSLRPHPGSGAPAPASEP